MLKILVASISAVAVQSASIIDIVAGSSNHTNLTAIVTDPQYADILAALNGSDLTLFAPTDEAFARDVPFDPLDASNVETVKAVLKYHVLGTVAPSSALTTLQFPQSVGGSNIKVAKSSAGVMLNDGAANVTTADIAADNGMVHIINGVIMPPSSPSKAATDAGFSVLVAALQKADLVATLDGLADVTVFAPTDAAFADANITSVDGFTKDALADILKYHLLGSRVFSTDLANGEQETVQGASVTINVDGGVKVNTATVQIADILVSNGVVHVIDKVLMPPAPNMNTTTTMAPDVTTAKTSSAVALGAGIVSYIAMFL